MMLLNIDHVCKTWPDSWLHGPTAGAPVYGPDVPLDFSCMSTFSFCCNKAFKGCPLHIYSSVLNMTLKSWVLIAILDLLDENLLVHSFTLSLSPSLVLLSVAWPDSKISHWYSSLEVLTLTVKHTAADWYHRDGGATGEQSSQLGVDEGITIMGTHWDCYALGFSKADFSKLMLLITERKGLSM